MSRVGVAGTRVPATPRSSRTAAAAYPVRASIALQAGLERPEGAGGVVERHLLAAGGGMRGAVFPVVTGLRHGVEAGVVAALRGDGVGRRVDRPERHAGYAGGALQAGEATRRCTLQVRQRARVRTREARVAGGVGPRK